MSMPRDTPFYTAEGDAFKQAYVNILENSGVDRVDRAIDIIYQTPDEIIIPYMEAALKRNPTGDPKKLASAISAAESNIFRDFQVFPGDEVHHGRASLSSMRNVRYLSPEERVLALNGLADQLGGPIGNSRFNLRGNSASRGAHTSGLVPWKMKDGRKYRDVFEIPRIPRELSMHPFGTDAAKDPRGIIVPRVDTSPLFIQNAVDSSKVQFNDTVTGRYSDMPRRIVIENLANSLQRNRGDYSTGSELLYGNNADPSDVKATKAFFQRPENQRYIGQVLQAAFHPSSPKGQAFLARPRNAAVAELLGEHMFRAIDPHAMLIRSAASIVKNNPLGTAYGAIADRDVGVQLGRGNYTSAAQRAATNGLLGGLIESGIKNAAPVVMKRLPAAAARLAAGSASTGGALMPALAAYTVYDLADGVVEGATGKGITQRVAPHVQNAVKQVVKTAPALINKANTVNKNLNPVGHAINNEVQYFIVNPIRSAYDRVFGNRKS